MREIPQLSRAHFVSEPWEEQMLLGAPEALILDTRSALEYFGALESLGYKKHAGGGGHVPGARWVNWKWSLDRDATLKPAA